MSNFGNRSTASATKGSSDKWRDNASALAVIYAMLEQGITFSTFLEGDQKFLEPVLDTMYKRELLDIVDGKYTVLPRGTALRDRMVAMFHQTTQFEVFGAVEIDAELDRDMLRPDNEALVNDEVDDPRFHDGPNAIDMRLAMMAFVVERLKHEGKLSGDFDPHLVVFIQQLGEGLLRADDFWYRLRSGEVFASIDRIVQAAYDWRSMREGDEQGSIDAMNNLYQAGMAQQRKLDGDVCGGCGIPLGMFAYYEEREGRHLKQCPNPGCKRRFPPPSNAASGDYECPKCQGAIHHTDDQCRSCGAVIGWNQPEGSVSTTTTVDHEVEEVYEPVLVWGGGWYGYTPVYYDPYEPLLIGAACGLALGVILY